MMKKAFWLYLDAMKALGEQKIVSGGRVEFPRTAYNS